ncbi:MAG: hypothetical protein QMC67_10190 [Candidatus Wallbacteria bacterium]
MKDLVSIRSEVGGVVEYFQIKTNKVKKVLLPGGMIFITNRDKKQNVMKVDFSKPVKYVLKSQIGTVLSCRHGDEIEEDGALVTIQAEMDGLVSIKKNKIIITKKTFVKEYEIDKNYEILVEDGATVKLGQKLAKIVSPFYGIVKYNFVSSDNEKDRSRKIDSVEILQNASAYEIPDDFFIKVSNGATIDSGAVIAEGVIREDSYGDLSIEKESFEEEKEDDEDVTTEEDIDEIDDDNGAKEDFNYEEEQIDSEFDDEEDNSMPAEEEEYQSSGSKRRKKS